MDEQRRSSPLRRTVRAAVIAAATLAFVTCIEVVASDREHRMDLGAAFGAAIRLVVGMLIMQWLLDRFVLRRWTNRRKAGRPDG